MLPWTQKRDFDCHLDTWQSWNPCIISSNVLALIGTSDLEEGSILDIDPVVSK